MAVRWPEPNEGVPVTAKPSTLTEGGALTKAEEVRQKVDALVASGARKADAFRQVADEYGQPFNSIRGAYYSAVRAVGGSTPRGTRSRKRTTTTEDAVEQATTVLNRAIEGIDAEIAQAKARADEAKAEYELLRDTAKERKVAIQGKIDVLTGQ
jgi:hypothetical protein